MLQNEKAELFKIKKHNSVPTSLISKEVAGLYGSSLLEEIKNLIDLYTIYEKGSDFTTEGSNGDYTPSDLRYKYCKGLIDKQARFLFARKPDIKVIVGGEKKSNKEQSQLQDFLDEVLKANNFFNELLKASKDCFIAKRIAIMVNFNDKGIKTSFIPALEFVYDTDTEGNLSKLIAFYTITDNTNKALQRIYKKKYYMKDGHCHVVEEIYDGLGMVIETPIVDMETLFTYIPGIVILNNGLLGDMLGSSDIEDLSEYESWYSRLNNADIDAERKGMNPVKYTVDMDSGSTKGLSQSAGAYWDLSTDINNENANSQVGVLESDMGYSTALGSTLDRLKATMHSQMDIPDTSSEALQGIITSGKTLKALYWGLIVRCDEKMKTWEPALEFIARTIIEGAKLYPNSVKIYDSNKIPDLDYEIIVENNYPLPEDEAEEKTMDIAEVNAETMSKKSYMKKWRGLTDDEALEELKQIALERQILEDSFVEKPMGGEEVE
jgi:hypothetical protein